MKSFSNFVAALVVAVVLLGTCASGANAALTVQNDLKETITVSFPPNCPGLPGPICIDGFDVESKQEESLPTGETYPLAYLQIQVGDVTFCVAKADLQKLTATTTVEVGAPVRPGGGCPDSIDLYIVDTTAGVRYYTCLQG